MAKGLKAKFSKTKITVKQYIWFSHIFHMVNFYT